ncbi:MAG: hypothetical protein JRH20_08575 [Deltaproteobacteria bacterium]|nr:hypothetical protein [Deltaproteobacteria bacterium]
MRADDSYRVLQMPLRTFSSLRHETLSQNLSEFSLGGEWSAGSRVRVDEVRVFW